METIGSFLQTDYELVNSKLLFQTIWHYTLTTEIVKSIAETTDLLFLSMNDRNRTYLKRYYDQNYSKLEDDFGTRVVDTLNEIVGVNGKEEGDKRRTAEEAVKSIRDYQLSRYLRDFGREERITIFVVADDLDKHWRPDNQQSIDLLIGLIAEVDRLLRYYSGTLKFVLFLREDIYDVLTRHDDDLPKRNLLRLEWTASNLKHLVAERLAVSAGQQNENDDETWSAIFPEAVNGRPAMDYIVSRSLPRPRDVLDLCQKAIDEAQRNGHEVVTASDIVDGEKSFSDGLFWSLSSEFKGLYPDLEYILFELEGVNEVISWKDFNVIASKAIQTNQKIFNDWVIDDPMTPSVLADVLFTIGVIGLSSGMTNEPHFCNGRSFHETWGFVSPSPVVHIHPAFRKVLEVSAVIQRSSRTPRGRKRVDPRQLALD